MSIQSSQLGSPGSSGTRSRSFAILSTFPPTPCGLATFSAALAGGLAANDAEVAVVRVGDGVPSTHPAVVGELVNNSPDSVRHCVTSLNRSEIAIIQHEYGIYGGADGDEILEILDRLEVPAIVVAHTVLSAPTPHQRAVLIAVAERAGRVVVMSEAARERLCREFEVDPCKVVTISHGATVPSATSNENAGKRPLILTWGLLGPGKGIERVIEAMAALADLPVRPLYLVAGQTHPKVVASWGESYRDGLIARAKRLGVASSIFFDDTYRDVASLTTLVQSCAVAVLPYDSTDQVTSGVLVDAIAAGRPVIATAFPHAVEMLASGAGIVVAHDDAAGLANALRLVLTDKHLAGQMEAEAQHLAPNLAWPVIASEYCGVADQLLAGSAVFA